MNTNRVPILGTLLYFRYILLNYPATRTCIWSTAPTAGPSGVSQCQPALPDTQRYHVWLLLTSRTLTVSLDSAGEARVNRTLLTRVGSVGWSV